ncbi:MAG: cytidylate kinase family protein, partial [Prevotella sp.]|nr:cytidylate kinase family protein [Prevotella sp.]
EALKIIHNAESQRASYYNYYTGKRWGDSASYDLCVNSCRLGLDATAQLVRDFIVKSSKL